MADDWEDEDDWEKAEEAAPAAAAPVKVATGVKNLEEEEEEEDEPEPAVSVASKYYGMPLADLVKELERRDFEAAKANAGPKLPSQKEKRRMLKEKEEKERERRRLEEAMSAEDIAETQAEIFARKMEQQRLVEDADLELAMDLMGDVPKEEKVENTDIQEVTLIEAMAPKSVEDFVTFRTAIAAKATKYDISPFYAQFVEDLSRDLCANLKPEEIKKIQAALNVMVNDKTKALLSKGKKKGKPNLKSLGGGKAAAADAFGGLSRGGGGADDYDDFM